jgi:hypothetical protein
MKTALLETGKKMRGQLDGGHTGERNEVAHAPAAAAFLILIVKSQPPREITTTELLRSGVEAGRAVQASPDLEALVEVK